MPFVPTSQYLDNIFESEQSFCQLYRCPFSSLIQHTGLPCRLFINPFSFLSTKKEQKYWTLEAATGNSGLAGAYYKTIGFFYGVEQRQYL